ncbi:hypothetical protein [Paenibacillus sp. NPDC058177]|uniref:hypothetical protein n=1 Tax=Paenibacillus sp. NPDC058177 TaxID=3346369 RepID=UPI0036DA1E69
MQVLLAHNFKNGEKLVIPLSDTAQSENVDFIKSVIAAKMDCESIEFTADDGRVLYRNYRDVSSVEIAFVE